MSDWDLKLTDARIASMRPGDGDYGTIEDGAIAIRDGLIEWIGPRAECPDGTASESRSLDGQWLTPALIDCHTHLVFGGNRASEFERRLQGESYEQIAAAGGGILATVTATRASEKPEARCAPASPATSGPHIPRQCPRLMAMPAVASMTTSSERAAPMKCSACIGSSSRCARRVGRSAARSARNR